MNESQPQTILIVDDNPTNIQLLFDVLEMAGYLVSVAKSGEQALQRLQNNLADLILLDVMMPGMDGFEVCQRLKDNHSTQDIPVIFMTALSDSVDKVKGLSLGAVDYITKPIQNEEVLARIRVHLQLRHLHQTLEERVADRTAELQQMMNHLQKAQMQLVQNEKLSSLGQLVAGVAHEINNPVNFIYGNLLPAHQYSQDLMDLVQTFRHYHNDPHPAVKEKIEEIDLDFITEDLPRLLNSMQVGADRIRQIVLSLRNFSRLDEAEMKSVDLRDGIESTLMILQHRLKAKPDYPAIEVVCHYADLPVVECYASQLNQVFMNLISNAIDALEGAEDSHQQPHPKISIHTQLLSPEQIRIRIADNGPGIPENIQAQLFDAFFTTKEIGKGTGLGLSISHQIIVDKHGGAIWCESQLGAGTQFIIDLPIHQTTPVSV